ncbi:MAG: adenylate/guanylate cyclase domain-containing protein [Reyranella sp.]|nr:adenylate/guanylate cyclase domain-containing protein [Reyranella sp.]
MSAVVLDGADARLRVRLREEEQNGSLFAFRARLVALGAISLWLLLAAGPMRVPVSLAACGALAVAAWLVYRTRTARWAKAIQAAVIVLEVSVIVVATMEVSPGSPTSGLWVEQVFGRRSIFLYLSVYLAASALSYSARTVVLTGVVCLVALLLSTVWTVVALARAANLDLLAVDHPVTLGFALLGQVIGPGFVTPQAFVLQQLIFMTICTAFIAAAVWRARAHLGRTLLAEGERNNLARYFSPNLVDRLAGAERDFEMGREEKATVLFVDVVGFTRLMEGLPPQLTITFLRAFHEHMAACIFRHGGTLDKFIGDGVMATFGTPDSQPDDEARALRCALDMVKTVADWNCVRHRRGLPQVRISVGVHVGPVLMGAIGSRNRLEYSAVGDTVNVASRLEHLSRDHDAAIVTSAETLSAAGLDAADAARFRSIGPVSIPGRAQPIEVFVVAKHD